MTTKRGLFIAVEGVDGSGKTTLIHELSKQLTKIGIAHILTREPGGTPLGSELRELLLKHEYEPTPLTELLLYTADRAQHVQTLIEPALATGKTVITDRYVASTIAYQHHARGLDFETVRTLTHIATNHLQADLTAFLDTSPAEAQARQAERNGAPDRLEVQPDQFKQLTYEAYQQLARNNPRWVTLNGNKNPTSNAHKLADKIQTMLHQRRQRAQTTAFLTAAAVG